ncbi:MAG: hypothetical protein AAES65_22190, partial [Candidatus Thiodiazotropha sp. (ex. Lucinoma kazani)]
AHILGDFLQRIGYPGQVRLVRQRQAVFWQAAFEQAKTLTLGQGHQMIHMDQIHLLGGNALLGLADEMGVGLCVGRVGSARPASGD